MTTDFNIIAELPVRNPTDEQASDLFDALVDYHPAISTSPLGWAEAILTIPAENARQATATALAVLGDVVSLTVMTTTEFDRRPIGVEKLPALLSVTEAADRLGVSRQAVLQRIESGALPATKIGATWAVPESVALPTSVAA